jgi:hypothetical protein
MQFNQPMFVLQRRINQPLEAVERVLCDPALLRARSTLALGAGLELEVERPFGVTFPPFGVDHASWSAPARVLTPRGRTVERFDVEINAWDERSTELLVRPRARHPYRWSGRRMRRYFGVAHATADVLGCRIGAGAGAPTHPVRFAPYPVDARQTWISLLVRP